MRNIRLILFLLGFIVFPTLYATEIDSLSCAFEQSGDSDNPQILLAVYKRYLQKLSDTEKFPELILGSEKAILAAKQYDDKIFLAEFTYYKGFGNERMGNYTKALAIYDQVVHLKKKEVEKTDIFFWALSGISVVHQQLGNFEKSYDYQIRALRGFEQLNDLNGICRSTYVIGSIFFFQKRYKQALVKYKLALDLARKADNPRLIFNSLGAMGSTYVRLNNIEKGLFYNRKALKLAKEINYDSGIAYTLNNLGICYLSDGQCHKAEDAILKSLAIKKRLNDQWGLLGGKFALSNIYKECKHDEKALSSYLATLEMSKIMGAKTRELEAYEMLISFYDDKDPLLAYDYTKKLIALKEKVFNEKTLEEMGQSRQRYEIDKKEHEISMLKAENKILNINRENQRLYKLLFVVSAILLILTIFWFFNRITTHRRVNAMLESKNDLLKFKNKEIKIKNKQLEHSNEDLVQFAYVASHDLKEPLRMIHSYTTLLKRRYNDQLDEDGKEFMHYIVDAVDRMKNLLDDLLDYSRSGNQQMPDQLVSVADMVVVVSANLKGQIEENRGSLIVRNENLPSILAHKSQLMQLLQNLISNGMKFRGERDPIIIIDCIQKNDQFVFSVKDNGIGISKANREKVFEMFRRLHTREEYAGSGIGLSTCKKIVSNMGGDIWVESEEGIGSTFFFAVPCPSEIPAPILNSRL